MTDAGPPGPPPYPAPLTDDFGPPGSYAPSGTTAPRRRPMLWRHLVGPLLALVVTPVGLMLIDYGAVEYLQASYRSGDPGPSAELLWLVAGGLFLTVAAASARLSGLGPLLAALVWALAPLLLFVVDRGAFFDIVREMPSTHLWFGYAPLEFSLAGALLLGAGIGGRWRGRVVP